MVALTLKTGVTCTVRRLAEADETALVAYLNVLSAESRSRFGPHSFDPETVRQICRNETDDVLRYLAFSPENTVVAYLLVKKGTLPEDRRRYENAGWVLDEKNTCTFAPSVADAWQSSGLGNAMFGVVLEDLRPYPFRQMLLWGGVQATNERAIRYYTRQGFELVGRFWHDGKDNLDMVKTLDEWNFVT